MAKKTVAKGVTDGADPQEAKAAEPPADAENARSEPPEATHQAEDETWDTGGDDAPHRLDETEGLRKEVAELEAKVKALEAELERANDRTLRARADYDNLQRRAASERSEFEQRAAARLIGNLLETLETMERAALEAEAAHDPRAKGVRMAFDGLLRTLQDEGLEPVPGVGEPFDHGVHQAIAKAPSDAPVDAIIEVVRPGYMLHGRLLREAMVKVSAGPATESEAGAD